MDDQYQPTIPLPGIRFGGQISGAWRRAFTGWRPDARTVGVLVVAVYLGLFLDRLLTADMTWSYFTSSLQPPPPLGVLTWQIPVGATMQVISLPVDALAVAGGAGLALRRGWGRPLALGALASVLAIQVVNVVTFLSRGPAVRQGIAQVLLAAGAALPVAVLLWSRPAAGEDA